MNLKRDLQTWAIATKELRIDSEILKNLDHLSSIAQENAKHISAFTFTYDVDGISVSGFLVAPIITKNNKLPVIIYNRGGTADYDLVTEDKLFTRFALMARWGFVIIGTQYPGNKLSEGHDERGGKSDIASVIKLHDLAKHLVCTDEERIGMIGFSRGGMMTYLCMKSEKWIKTAVTIGGLTDLNSSLEFRPEMEEVLNKSFKNTQRARDARSVVKWVDKLNRIPLCILHGGADVKVNTKDTLNLALELEAINYPYSLHIIKDGEHGLMNVRQERDQIIKTWFQKYLAKE